MRKTNSPTLIIPEPRLVTHRTGCRVSVEIAGAEVYFESDRPLLACAEAFASAFLFPAMSQGADLRIEAPVCSEWLKNMAVARGLARSWWNFSGGRINAPAQVVPVVQRETGMFFSAGADSFFTLLTTKPSLLVFVEGFDVDLRDEERLRKMRTVLRTIAEAKGVELMILRTNLREHHYFRSTVCWEAVSHGPAKAAVGHCLSERLSRILIASANTATRASNMEIDPTWSSNRIYFHHHEPQVRRIDKVRHIVHDPLVARHLRVCWENRASDLNCGACEKCVRTQLELTAADPGFFERQSCFPKTDLAEQLARLPVISPRIMRMWRDIEQGLPDGPMKDGVRGLLERTDANDSAAPKSVSPWRRLWRRLKSAA